MYTVCVCACGKVHRAWCSGWMACVGVKHVVMLMYAKLVKCD